MTASSPEIRPLGAGDDISAELDLRRRSFGPVTADQLPGWTASVQASIDAGEMLGAFDGTRLVGSARYFPMEQWWYGRPMPMAGVAGVKVAPEERGRGVGKALMTRLIAEMSALRYPVSVLYPATMPLYRRFGWENAGGKYETVLPIGSLEALLPPDPLAGARGPGAAGAPGSGAGGAAGLGAVAGDGRGAADTQVCRATVADAQAVVDVLGTVHKSLRDCGPATHLPGVVSAWLDDEDHFAYLASDGFLSYRWAQRHSELNVEFLVAASAATARTFWRILASHASMTDTVRVCLAPDDPIDWLTREPAAEVRRVEGWMLRILDPAAAIAARGFPSAVTLTAELELTDDVMSANSGCWRLEVSGGAGALTQAAPADRAATLRLGARGLAALFAGAPMVTLRLAGLVTGGNPAADEELDGAFACRPPFMLHNF